MTEVTVALDDVTLRATVTGTGPTSCCSMPAESVAVSGHRRGADGRLRAADGGLRFCAVTANSSGGQHASGGPPTTDPDGWPRAGAIVVVGASLGGLAAIAALAANRGPRAVSPGLVLVDVVPDPDPNVVRPWLATADSATANAELVDDILGSGPELLAAATCWTCRSCSYAADHGLRSATPTVDGSVRSTATSPRPRARTPASRGP